MKKILIIKMSALGDVMIAYPHIETIVEHHLGDEIWVLTGPDFAELFIHHPHLRIAVLDRADTLFGNSTLSRIFWVRKNRFDCIYDLQGNRTSRLLVRFSGSPVKVGTQPKTIYTHSPRIEYTRETRQNVFERLNETLVAGGLPPTTPGCILYPSGKARKKVIEWKNLMGLIDANYALLHAGSSREWPSKRWPEKYFATLSMMLEASGIQCIWVGGPDEKTLNERLAGGCGIDATGLFSPIQLYDLAKNARFAVTNDSGPMHVIAASGIPVFAFFGPTDWIRSHCAGQGRRVFTNEAPCSPCFSGVCKSAQSHICMTDIRPEQVFQTIKDEVLSDRTL